MTPSDLCIAWIKHSEGLRLTAYPDVSGYSIGYGHHGVAAGTVWTEAQCDAALAADVGAVADAIAKLVKVPLTQGQFDALADFCFNEGSGALARSSLLFTLNAGRYNAVPDCLYHVDELGEPHGWIYANGEVSKGLIARRQGEIVLWNGGNPLER